MLDIPREDHAMIEEEVNAIVPLAGTTAKTEQALAIGNAGMRTLTDYFARIIKARRAKMGDDLLSTMIAAADAGEFADEEELIANIVLIYFAGHDTTASSSSLAYLSLFRNPDEFDKLRRDPALMPRAVEELLRYEASTQATGRFATKDVTIRDKKVEAGAPIIVYLAAGNRDPDVFKNPDKLDFNRERRKTLAFGGGAHACLGNQLARQELTSGISALMTKRPQLRPVTLNPPDTAFKASQVSRGVMSLMVRG